MKGARGITIVLGICIFFLLLGAALFCTLKYRLYKYENMRNTEDLQVRIDRLGEAYINSNNNVGLVIGVIQMEKVYIQGYGKKSKESSDKPDSSSLFELASTSKLFTTSALQVFHDRGDLSIYDSIDKFSNNKVNLTEDAKATTLLQLATHTSGFPSLPDSFIRKVKNELNPYKYLTKADLYEYLTTCEGKKSGGKYKYSNFGLGLLGHIFELKYKDTYENIIKSELCNKLGMEDTTITLDNKHRLLLVQGYNANGLPNPIWEDKVLTGAGSFLSNASDMIKFIKANLNESYSSISESLIKTHTKQLNVDIGIGWHYPMFGEKFLGLNDIIWHNGMAGGYSSYIAIDKKNNIGVIILSNTANDVRSLGVKVMLYSRKVSLN